MKKINIISKSSASILSTKFIKLHLELLTRRGYLKSKKICQVEGKLLKKVCVSATGSSLSDELSTRLSLRSHKNGLHIQGLSFQGVRCLSKYYT